VQFGIDILFLIVAQVPTITGSISSYLKVIEWMNPIFFCQSFIIIHIGEWHAGCWWLIDDDRRTTTTVMNECDLIIVTLRLLMVIDWLIDWVWDPCSAFNEELLNWKMKIGCKKKNSFIVVVRTRSPRKTRLRSSGIKNLRRRLILLWLTRNWKKPRIFEQIPSIGAILSDLNLTFVKSDHIRIWCDWRIMLDN
jgi:hypothetical protein